MDSRDALHARIKAAVVSSLATTELTVDDIDTDAVLFGAEGMGFDSVDALELAFEIEEAFGVEIPDDEAHRAVFTSVRTLADFLVNAVPGLLEATDSAP